MKDKLIKRVISAIMVGTMLFTSLDLTALAIGEGTIEEAQSEEMGSYDGVDVESSTEGWAYEKTYDAETKNISFAGSGTEEDPVQISTLEDMINLSTFDGDYKYVHDGTIYCVLTQDIKMNESLDQDNLFNWSGIERTKNNGIVSLYFDGCGHTIENIYMGGEKAKPFFRVAYYSYISNLSFKNVKIDYYGIGLPSLSIMGAENSGRIFSNCTIFGDIEINVESSNKGSVYIGGFSSATEMENCRIYGGPVGRANIVINVNMNDSDISVGGITLGGGKSSNIIDCEMNGSLTVNAFSSDVHVYGIASSGNLKNCTTGDMASITVKTNGTAYAAGIGGGTTISNCINNAKILADGAGGSYAAGIANYIYQSSITECVNNGYIEACGEENSYAAGIVNTTDGVYAKSTIEFCDNNGVLIGTDIAGIGNKVYGTISNCNNLADLESKTDAGTASGIVTSFGHGIIENCSNTGNLQGQTLCAGIAGYMVGLSSSKGDVIECVNSGNIESTASNGVSGGIVGEVEYGSIIEKCTNNGAVSGYQEAGGIVGRPLRGNSGANIKECTNTGEIIALNGVAGGICGDGTGNNIQNSYNLGNVSAFAADGRDDWDISAGGIVGTAGVISICQSYNSGNIASHHVGGVLGQSSGTTTIENCFNCGNLSAKGSYYAGSVGGIAGWMSHGGSINNCYVLGIADMKEVYEESPGGIIGNASSSGISMSNCYWINSFGEESIQSTTLLEGDDPVKITNCAARSAAELQDINTYSQWDFTDVWKKGNKRYPFPMLNGVGENELRYKVTESGEGIVYTTQYILQVVDQDGERGISGVVITYKDSEGNTCQGKTDANGMFRFYFGEGTLDQVTFNHRNYEQKEQTVLTVYPGEVNQIKLTRREALGMPELNITGTADIFHGSLNVDNEDMILLNFPLSIDLGDALGPNTPFSMDVDAKNMTVTINFGLKNQTSIAGSKGDYIADLIEKTKDPATGKERENWKEILEKGGAYTGRSTAGAGVGIYYLGSVTYSYASSELELIKSTLLVGWNGQISVTDRPVWAGGIAYGTVALGVDSAAGLTVSLNSDVPELVAQGILRFEQSMKVAVGIGGDILGVDFAHAEIGAVGKLTETINIPSNGYFDIDEDLQVKLDANVYFEGQILAFQVKKPSEWKGVTIWPKDQSTTSNKAMNSNSTFDFGGLTDGDEYLEMADRSYLSGTAVKNVQASAVASLNMDSVYPDGNTKIVELAGGARIAVWLADDGSKRAADRTTLMYAMIEDGKITASGKVASKLSSERGDYYPTLYAKGNNVWVAWLNADKTYREEVTWSELSTHLGLYLASWDGNAKQFGEPIRINATDSGKRPISVSLASNGREISVSWVENQGSSAFGTDGNNVIYRVTDKDGVLSGIVKEADQITNLYGFDSAYIGESLSIFWTQSNEQKDQAELYRKYNDEIITLTDDDRNDTYIKVCGSNLYWISDGHIYCMEDMNIGKISDTGVVCNAKFDVLAGTKGTAILWLEKDGFANTPMVSYKKGNGFSGSVALFELEKTNISSISGIYEEDGSISLFYDSREVLDDWSESPYGQTSMRYETGLVASDIAVGDLLYYDEKNTAPGAEIVFRTDVYNKTDRSLDALTLKLYQDNKIVKTETVVTDLVPGEVKEVQISYVLPDQINGKMTYILEVSNAEISEKNVENNRAVAEVGHGNLSLKNFKVMRLENGAGQITGIIENTGYSALKDVTFTAFYSDPNLDPDENSENEIDEKRIGVLEAGATCEIVVNLEADAVEIRSTLDQKHFFISVTTSDDEFLYSDNQEIVYLQSDMAESIQILDDTQKQISKVSLKVGESMQLQPKVLPDTAFADCLFTSSDISVVVVDANGLLRTTGEGTAQITVFSADGQAKQSLQVSVSTIDGANENLEFYLDNEKIGILKNESAQLSVLWDADEETELISRNIVWSTENSDIVRIEKSTDITAQSTEDLSERILETVTLTGLSEGTTIVNAFCEEAGVSLTCMVTVTDKGLTYAQFEESQINLVKENDFDQPTYQLKLTTVPEVISMEQITLISDDNKVASIDSSGKVTAGKEGTTLISAIYDGLTVAVCRVTVSSRQKEIYYLFFDSNGGLELPENESIQDAKYSEQFEFPGQPERSGYYFTGWNTAKDGSGTAYSGSEQLIAGQNVENGLILYAQWISIEGKMTVADIPDMIYTGSAVKPVPVVYDGTKLLVLGKDYTISYKNNTKVDISGKAQPSITITGKGNYTGKQTVTFHILPCSLGDSSINVSDLTVAYNGKNQTPVPIITRNGKKLVNKKDYIISYPAKSAETGTYEMFVAGQGNYTGKIAVRYNITNKLLLNKATISGIKAIDYTGEEVTPKPIVKYRGTELIENQDYTLEYQNNILPGTAAISIVGMGDYAGEKKVTFKIKGKSLASAKVEGLVTNVEYTGASQTQDSCLLSIKGEIISEDNYTVSYQNNINAGTATIIFTGKNGYEGSVKKIFKIVPYNLKEDSQGLLSYGNKKISTAYTKGGSCPDPDILWRGHRLKAGVDYKISFKNNKQVTEGNGEKKQPTIVVTGKGNYKGTISIPFTIVKQSISATRISVPDKGFSSRKNGWKTTVKIVDLDEKTLKLGTDYDLKYVYTQNSTLEDQTTRSRGQEVGEKDVLSIGTKITVIVSGKNNYTGETQITYTIRELDISKAKVTVKDQAYTGVEVKPSGDQVVVQISKGQPLLQGEQKKDGSYTEGDYAIIDYKNNIVAGKAQLTIRGIGRYGGEKVVSFKIGSRKLWFWTWTK